MGNRCYSVNKKRKIDSTPSSCATVSTMDTQGYVETEARIIENLGKREKEVNFDFSKKPIFKKLLEKNKAKNNPIL